MRIDSLNYCVESNSCNRLSDFPTLLILLQSLNISYIACNGVDIIFLAKPSFMGYHMAGTTLKSHIPEMTSQRWVGSVLYCLLAFSWPTCFLELFSANPIFANFQRAENRSPWKNPVLQQYVL